MTVVAPAHGCSVKSLVVWPTPLRVRACGSDSAKSGASNSERGADWPSDSVPPLSLKVARASTTQ
jgi:hypothetical protein